MRLLSVLLGLMLLAPAAAAQAWTQAPGAAYVKLSHGRATASEQFRFDGETKPYADNVDGDAFFDRSLYLYAEYGLTETLTLVAVLPYKRLRVRDAAFDYESEGLGSVAIGLRTGLNGAFGVPADRHRLALNVLATVPTGYTRNFTPSVGSGQVDVQATLAYGASLWPLPGYAQAAVGYRYRSAFYALSATIDCQPGRDVNCIAAGEPKYDDELLFSAEAGVSLGRWALVQALGHGVWSNKPPDAETSFSVRNPIPTRQRYVKAGGGLTVYPVRALGLGVQVFFTPAGRNTVRSTDVFWGVEYRIP
ncbi:MAG: hypothetical protein R3247_17195 [Rhodothermales bacterium]|nr:hypothetical protein [Rhodothermales bacterium]